MANHAAPVASWFADVAERSGLIFFVMRIRPEVAFEYVGSALEARLGVPVGAALADPQVVLDLIESESRDRFIASLAMEPGQEMSMDLAWRHLDGRVVDSRAWVRATQRPDGSVVQEGVVLDITELRAAEADLRRSEQRNRLLAENAYDVIWTMGMDGTVTYVSPAVQRMRGFTPEEAARQTIEEINLPESAARVTDYYQQVFAAMAAGTEPPVFRGEIEYYRKDGSTMTGELQVTPLMDADGQVFELLGVTRDISDRKRYEAELAAMAATDPVTDLGNRRHVSELLSANLVRARRNGRPMAVLMIDVDHFKAINDKHGHRRGDHVLIEVARRLREQIRGTDVVGRWGGEEFVVGLCDCPPADARAVAEKLRREIADTPFGTPQSVTVSIGVAQLADDDDLGSWLDRADAALYRAKSAGRNTVAEG